MIDPRLRDNPVPPATPGAPAAGSASYSVTDTLRALMGDATDLVSHEVRLAKAEASEKVDQAATGIAEIIGGAILALAALFVLVQALVIGLQNIFDSVPPSLIALAVGLVLALVAYLTAMAGVNALKAENLAPKRTIKSVQRTGEKLREVA